MYRHHQANDNMFHIVSDNKLKKYAKAFVKFGVFGAFIGLLQNRGVMSRRKEDAYFANASVVTSFF